MLEENSPFQRTIARRQSLKSIRENVLPDLRACGRHFAPGRGRFDNESGAEQNNREKGTRFDHIHDNTPLRAVRTTAAGLMSGMSSPARPWFRVQASIDDLNDIPAVKRWTDDTTRVLRDLFGTTNTYHVLHHQYEELATFGTACSLMMFDPEKVMHGHPMTAGEYMLATNAQGRVDTVYREFRMTVAQMVAKFERGRLSRQVISLLDRNQLDKTVEVVHAIEPRHHRQFTIGNQAMPWREIYLEPGSEDNQLLMETGYNVFPGIAPRWMTVANDVYGQSPGLMALGDARQLQAAQLRKGQGIDFSVAPELLADRSLEGEINRGPNAITYGDPDKPVRRLYELNLDMGLLLEDIRDVRSRIEMAFYNDLFLMLAGDDRATPPTAREVVERHEEKLTMIGPVIVRLHNESLDPLVDIGFEYAMRAGLIDDPPPELQGTPLKVKYTSVLAQALEQVGLGSIERLLAMATGVAQLQPEAVDRLDGDKAISASADMLGVDPDVVRSDDQVQEIRQARAQAQQAAEQAALAEQGAKAVKSLSDADTGGTNALSDMLTGYVA